MVDAALLCCRSAARLPLLFLLYFPKAFANKPVSALRPWQATALPHGWLPRLRGTSHACTRVQRTLRGRLIKTHPSRFWRWSVSLGCFWGAAAERPRAERARQPPRARRASLWHARCQRSASCRQPEEDADKPRVDVLHVRLGREAPPVRAGTILPNICVATDVTLYTFFPLSLSLLLRGRDARWDSLLPKSGLVRLL